MTIEDEMRRAGWYPERKADTSAAMAALRAEGVSVWPGLESFLAEFSGLDFQGHLDDAILRIDAVQAARVTDAEWGRAYGTALGQSMAPVGEYFHMTIYLAEGGDLYGGVGEEWGRLGSALPEVLDAVLNRYPVKISLDRELST